MKTYIGNYTELLQGFTDKGYRPIFFDQSNGSDGELLLRHDVDFDCRLAHKLSLEENRLGITSTYFFLVRSNSYNLFSRENAAIVHSIHAHGHRVSIHFDPALYDDVEKGFSQEKALFETFFNIPVEIVSVHRPNDFLKDCDQSFCGVAHTYQNKYFKDIKYVSDGQGLFRFGHPFETDAWKENRPIQLLIHPIWWMVPGASSNLAALDHLVTERTEEFQNHIAKNCIPYKQRSAAYEEDRRHLRLQTNDALHS